LGKLGDPGSRGGSTCTKGKLAKENSKAPSRRDGTGIDVI